MLGVFVIFVVVSFVNSSIASRAPVCKNCNVIILSLDTVGANHLPCYGYARNTAPNLCAFADKNILFKNAYANATWTLPSDVSMFTSLYPRYHGIRAFADYNLRLPETMPILPEILREAGYRTIFGVPLNDRAFPIKDIYYKGITDVVSVGTGLEEDLGAALNAFFASASKGQKTFLFLHSYQAHGPYIPKGKERLFTHEIIPNIPTTWNEMYDNFSQDFYEYLIDELSKTIGKPNATIDQAFFERLKNARTLSEARKIAYSRAGDLESYYTEYYYFAKINLRDPKQVEYIKALYDQKIFELDSWIGGVLTPFLNNPAIKNNTIVVITAEHGEEFMEHGRISHVTLYDSNVKIPLILAVPGLRARSVSTPVQMADITPTILDLVGIPSARNRFQGVSLAAPITGTVLSDRLLFADDHDIVTARSAQWKLFMKRDAAGFVPYELYDMVRDPAETQNVLASHLDVAKQLSRQSELYEKKWERILTRF